MLLFIISLVGFVAQMAGGVEIMGRPITTGTGVRLSSYIPRALWERLDDMLNQLDGVPVSVFVQEAISRYLDDLEGVQHEAESTTEGV